MGDLMLVEEVNGEARVSSKVIAELSGARLDSVHKIIRNYIEEIASISDIMLTKEHSGANPKKIYQLSKQQWKYVLSRMKRTTGVEFCATSIGIDLNCIIKRVENQLHSILTSICNGYIGFRIETQYTISSYRLDFCVVEKVGKEDIPCFFVEYNERRPHNTTSDEDLKRILDIKSHINIPCIVIEDGYEMSGITAFVTILNSGEVNSMEATSYKDVEKLEGVRLYV